MNGFAAGFCAIVVSIGILQIFLVSLEIAILVYFGDNGAAKTGVTTVSFDGSNYTFNFKSNGSPRGVGETGMWWWQKMEKDKL